VVRERLRRSMLLLLRRGPDRASFRRSAAARGVRHSLRAVLILLLLVVVLLMLFVVVSILVRGAHMWRRGRRSRGRSRRRSRRRRGREGVGGGRHAPRHSVWAHVAAYSSLKKWVTPLRGRRASARFVDLVGGHEGVVRRQWGRGQGRVCVSLCD